MMNVAIVGCGAVVEELHAAVLKKLEKQNDIKVSALIDASEDRLDRFRRLFPRAGIYRELDRALAGAKIDITLVASPPSFHRLHAGAALQNGSHVLCEKPLTTSASEATELVDIASESRRICGVGMTRRYFASLALVAEMVGAGELGDQLEFTYREGELCNWPLTSDALFRRSTAGGGVLADKGVHVLDSLLWVFGAMEVQSVQDDAQLGGVEGSVSVSLRGQRVHGSVQLSFDQFLNNGFWIRGEKGELFAYPGELHYVAMRRNGSDWQRVPCRATWPADPSLATKKYQPKNYDECIRLQWIAMLRAVKYGEKMPVDAARASYVIAQIESAYQMARPMNQAWLGQRAAVAAAQHWRNLNAS